tara:strand:- start:2046 stop:2354 length:309 start_codon:yes stop_codon:yes gene_type:complete
MQLLLLQARFAVCRLSSETAFPKLVQGSELVSLTRTSDELSVVCEEKLVPEDVRSEPGWRCLKVSGSLEFSLVGILSSLLDPLQKAKVSVFAISTFDTDYCL